MNGFLRHSQLFWYIRSNMNNENNVDFDDVIWHEEEISPPRKLGCDAMFSGE